MNIWSTGILSFVTMTLDFVIIGILTYFAIQQQKLNQYLYYIVAVFIVGHICAFYLFSQGLDKANTSFLLVVAAMVLGGLCITYFSTFLNLNKIFHNSLVDYSLAAFAIIIALALLYSFQKSFFDFYLNEKRPTWFGLFINLLFFLPCMIHDFIDFITKEWFQTSISMIILLFIEIGIITLYFMWPKITSNIIPYSLLMTEPAFLNYQAVLSGSDPMIIHNVVSNSDDNSTHFRNEYAISMWIYINDYTKISVSRQVFSYGGESTTQNYKPIIWYQENQLKFAFSGNKPQYSCPLLLQKWNNIVVNYKLGDADLFINGDLQFHYSFQKGDSPTYDLSDQVTIGDEHGVDGAICNVRYYPFYLSKSAIAMEYNALQLFNPPLGKA